MRCGIVVLHLEHSEDWRPTDDDDDGVYMACTQDPKAHTWASSNLSSSKAIITSILTADSKHSRNANTRS